MSVEYLEFVPPAAHAETLEFFHGERKEFSPGIVDLAFAQGGTEFQVAVWRAIAEIPYGETRSYKEIAGRIGRPNAMRAVGTACGKNMWPVVIPCHRVVASNGIGGYGFGLEMKKKLLAIEGVKIS